MKAFRYLSLAVLTLAMATMTSCGVSKKQYQQLEEKYNTLIGDYKTTAQDLANCQGDYKSASAQADLLQRNNDELKRQYDALQQNLSQSLQQNSQGNVNIAKLVDQIQEANSYIKQLVEAKSKSDSLNMVLTNNLTRSLSREDMRDVDIKVLKGVVYISLADNMLFKSGSYEVSDQAMSILGKIAKIIKDYSSYEVLVEGNTDNVPISKTNIRNNWDLSALRASSVVQILQDRFGVAPDRLTAGGRGEYNPLASNDTAEGRAQNRRTQIIVTPNLDQFMELLDQAPETEAEITSGR